MSIWRSRGGLMACVSLLILGCDGAGNHIVDDRGPPAGYGVVAGTVRMANGTPVGNAEVLVSRCGGPAGGFFAVDLTDRDGHFRAAGTLPPAGVLPAGIADTLRLKCSVFFDRTGVVRDSVVVRFGRTPESAPTQVVNLIWP